MSRFAVRIVAALRVKDAVTGKRVTAFVPAPDILLDSKRQCLREAERLQAAFDRDCDPKRAFVIAPDGVPCAAAGVPTHWARSTL